MKFIWHDRDRFYTRKEDNGDSIHCAYKGDTSPVHLTYPQGYDGRCSSCWLGHSHTEQVHQDNILNAQLRSMNARMVAGNHSQTRRTTMKHFLITWHETDGNDTVVFDTVVTAKTQENAFKRLLASWLKNAPDAEYDGDEGIYYACDCDEEDAEYCEGHGGCIIRSFEEYPSRKAAEDATVSYHSTYTI